MLAGQGQPDRYMSDDEVRRLCAEAVSKMDVRDKRVLVIIPDHTRTAPIDLMFRTLYDEIGTRAKAFDILVALGTHPPMPQDRILERVGITAKQRAQTYGKVRFFNHIWDDAATFRRLGTISADEVHEISGGLMKENVPVDLNKMVFDYDQLVIVGPVFPHEVVGFSGGNKYLFPGIAGPEIINFFHWLGAVITNPVINGTKDTPVRAVVDRAADMLDVPLTLFGMVVTYEGLSGLYIGPAKEAWSAAADLSARVHIVYKDRSFDQVLSVAPAMYDDIWTAGKCMYKLEPVVADGGELIIYAPHVTEISYTHGTILDEIGYHVRDYFRTRMDQFAQFPRGVTAHSTHVKGIGTFENGVEHPRVNVVLATGIPEERCRRVNLGYRDPSTIDVDAYRDREHDGVLLVPKAGEMLYRLADGTVPRIPGDPGTSSGRESGAANR